MRFSKPHGELWWLSILWFIGALAGIWLGVSLDMVWISFLSGALLIATIGLWFQSESARRFLIGWFCVVILLGIILMCLKGVDLRGVVQLAGAAFSVYELLRNGQD